MTPIRINYKFDYRMSEQPLLESSTTTTKLGQQDGSAWDGYTAPLDQHTAKIYGNTIDQYDTCPDYALDLLLKSEGAMHYSPKMEMTIPFRRVNYEQLLKFPTSATSTQPQFSLNMPQLLQLWMPSMHWMLS